jgi:hypothetical protein
MTVMTLPAGYFRPGGARDAVRPFPLATKYLAGHGSVARGCFLHYDKIFSAWLKN